MSLLAAIRVRNREDAGNQTFTSCAHCGTLFPQDPAAWSRLCITCWAAGAEPVYTDRLCPWTTHVQCGERAAERTRQRYADNRRARATRW